MSKYDEAGWLLLTLFALLLTVPLLIFVGRLWWRLVVWLWSVPVYF